MPETKPISAGEQIRRMYRAGHSVAEIHAEVKCSRRWVELTIASVRVRQTTRKSIESLKERVEELEDRLALVERVILEGRTDGVQSRLAEVRNELAKQRPRRADPSPL